MKKDEKTKRIQENSAFRISSFSFIDLKKFFEEVRDNAWKELNNKLDSEYIEGLRDNMLKSFEEKQRTLSEHSRDELRICVKNICSKKARIRPFNSYEWSH